MILSCGPVSLQKLEQTESQSVYCNTGATNNYIKWLVKKNPVYMLIVISVTTD